MFKTYQQHECPYCGRRLQSEATSERDPVVNVSISLAEGEPSAPCWQRLILWVYERIWGRG